MQLLIDALFLLILVIVIGFVYVLPSYIAAGRHHKNIGPIFILNLFLGWTVIVWILVLAWAYSAGGHRES